ncbi:MULTISPECIES: Yip1 family protein [Photobacterium]|uniref:Membrane protein n=1 Tax=Photobacterium halotolerans TaxID=265726 RepID=A0A0F5VH99_9GAMM|nr:MULTISPECIES: Yip1 family protein [Photobacterium]KKD01443.1 membrane protein [Photobacterium halotolerans]UIP27182.1 YIP1 family protein [Photobacterium sp. TLY01]
MILGHLFGLYTHPKKEWHNIDEQHEGMQSSLSHIMLIALLPPIFAYISSVFIGWRVGAVDPIYLTPSSALFMSIAMYFALIGGVFALAYLTYWMSHTFGSTPTYTQALELAAYTATPLFMVSIAALYPQLWFLMMAGLVGITYSVYLLYTGVPILMHIPEERGFIYASSIVTCGLVLLVSIIAGSVILWNVGLGPQFSH